MNVGPNSDRNTAQRVQQKNRGGKVRNRQSVASHQISDQQRVNNRTDGNCQRGNNAPDQKIPIGAPCKPCVHKIIPSVSNQAQNSKTLPVIAVQNFIKTYYKLYHTASYNSIVSIFNEKMTVEALPCQSAPVPHKEDQIYRQSAGISHPLRVDAQSDCPETPVHISWHLYFEYRPHETHAAPLNRQHRMYQCFPPAQQPNDTKN